MGGQEPVVDGWYDGKKCNGWFSRLRRGREERFRQTVPYGADIEGKEKFDAGARKERSEESVEGSVDVV